MNSGARMAGTTNHILCASSENRIRPEPEIPDGNQMVSGGIRAHIPGLMSAPNSTNPEPYIGCRAQVSLCLWRSDILKLVNNSSS